MPCPYSPSTIPPPLSITPVSAQRSPKISGVSVNSSMAHSQLSRLPNHSPHDQPPLQSLALGAPFFHLSPRHPLPREPLTGAPPCAPRVLSQPPPFCVLHQHDFGLHPLETFRSRRQERYHHLPHCLQGRGLSRTIHSSPPLAPPLSNSHMVDYSSCPDRVCPRGNCIACLRVFPLSKISSGASCMRRISRSSMRLNMNASDAKTASSPSHSRPFLLSSQICGKLMQCLSIPLKRRRSLLFAISAPLWGKQTGILSQRIRWTSRSIFPLPHAVTSTPSQVLWKSLRISSAVWDLMLLTDRRSKRRNSNSIF